MTQQVEEKITIKDEKYDLITHPLYIFLRMIDENLKLIPFGSHCWRGYMGEWIIIHDQLFLDSIKIQYHPKDEKLMHPFKDYGQIMFADWYIGELRAGIGEPIIYHFAYVPIYEKEMVFFVEKGIIVSKKTVENEIPEIEDNGLPF